MNTGSTLRERVINATSWVMTGHITGQLLRLISNLIMTRLLVPEMFGIMAVANTLVVGLALMSDIGISQHIIQSKRSNDSVFIDTAWVVQIIRGIIIWIGCLIISLLLYIFNDYGWWSSNSVYANPQLPYILATLSFTAVIYGCESTKISMANRNLAMNQVVKITLISQILGILLMVIWAYFDKTIWALVAGALFSSLSKMLFSHIFLSGRNNKIQFDKESFFELFHFGKWIFLTSALGFLAMNGDKLVLAGMIDTKLLGIYTIAIFIINAIQQLFSKLIHSVALPAFSEVVRERPDELNRIYYKLRLPLDFVILFIAGLFFMAGHHAIEILYDDRYKYAGSMIEILALMLIFERFFLTNQCFIALGKPSYMLPLQIMQIPVLYIVLPLVYREYGLNSALWVIALNRLAEWPVLFYLKAKLSLLNIVKEIYYFLFIILGIISGWLVNIML